MPLTPQITLTATLQDFCGNAAGTAANPAKLRIALVGYGPVLPCIAGTSNIAQVGPWYYYSTGAEISITLWGNDVITPLTVDGDPITYYEIAVIDGDGNMVQCAAYRFTGAETIDLSNAVPFDPTPSPIVPYLVYVKCTGTFPGTVYTGVGFVVMVVLSGTPQRPGIDYNVASQKVITFTFETQPDDNVYALCVVVQTIAPLVYEECDAIVAGTQYQAVGEVIMVTVGGIPQRPVLDYTVSSANVITLNFSTGDSVYALCVE